MQQHSFTTPFGRRKGTLGQLATQVAAKGLKDDATVHKWQVFRDITEIKDQLKIADRAIAVLYALLSFHQETTLTAGTALIVFPSNKELALRAHGIAAATLRRHLAALVEAGVIIRRDSPNGKRYARRGQGGEVERSFGFDITPLVGRAIEFANLAEEVRSEKRTVALLRERITLARRDIAKMVTIGLENGVPGDWTGFHVEYLALSRPMPRNAESQQLAERVKELEGLRGRIEKILETHIHSQNMSGNESHFERHIQNSKPDSFDLEPVVEDEGAAKPGPTEPTKPLGSKSEPARTYPLGMVLEACPEIASYAKHGISSWRDLMATAATVRSALGVSPDAWDKAIEAMGQGDAAVVIAAILQKGDEIKSPGGYLRALTDRANAGQFSLGPLLMALLRGNLGKGSRERAKTG